MSKHVVILGGGVAGLSAAHELAERGFQGTVYEHNAAPGGKARSFPANVPTQPCDGMPAEHGFRFFPGFYRHLIDTMDRIPAPGGAPVSDRLRRATEVEINFNGNRHRLRLPFLPTSLADFREVLNQLWTVKHVGTHLAPEEVVLYASKLWRLLSSCEERRADELEGMTWSAYIEATGRSEAYRKLMGRMVRVLVAADPDKASAKTVGDILLQMVFDLSGLGGSPDRVLSGPTSQVWIDPWKTYLETKNVTFKFGSTVTAIRCVGGRVEEVQMVTQAGAPAKVTRAECDYFLAALPVEVMAGLVTGAAVAGGPAIPPGERVVDFDPALGGLSTLAGHVQWMTGIQFYLTAGDFTLPDPVAIQGHQMHLDSPWALTSLHQTAFWPSGALDGYAGGQFKGILSVDISDWDTNGWVNWRVNGGRQKKTGKQCTNADEIAIEVWEQLRGSRRDLASALRAVDVEAFMLGGTAAAALPCYSLDPAIRFGQPGVTNAEPLLVNEASSWQFRPDVRTAIPNLFLAADYVRTYTDLATMEAANEAARRAVNAILDAAGISGQDCGVWKLYEPGVLKPLRWLDSCRYRHAAPWDAEAPAAVQAVQTAVLAAAPPLTTVLRPQAVVADRRNPAPERIQRLVADFVFDRLRPFVEHAFVADPATVLGFLPGPLSAPTRIRVAGRMMTPREFVEGPRTNDKEFVRSGLACFRGATKVEMHVDRVESIEVLDRNVFASLEIRFVSTLERLREVRTMSGVLRLQFAAADDELAAHVIDWEPRLARRPWIGVP